MADDRFAITGYTVDRLSIEPPVFWWTTNGNTIRFILLAKIRHLIVEIDFVESTFLVVPVVYAAEGAGSPSTTGDPPYSSVPTDQR